MNLFGDWLLSPEGEKKDNKTSKQHVSQLQKILSVTGGELASLLDAKKIRDVFFPHAEKKYHPSTIKSYLMSLKHYCSFVLGDQPAGVHFEKGEVAVAA